MTVGRPSYPFSAIAGQEALKRVLLLVAVDPSIGGALIRGQKGTAKSTAVRALASLLPPATVVDGCPLRCGPDDGPHGCPWCAEQVAAGVERRLVTRPVPLVELPLAASEDRVAGSFNLEEAIQHGRRRFEPGLLAAANRGALYVDEVNLLPDHLVDVILDAAASGVHRVEREGVSVAHAARFILVGTMNPEEGELRPQLLDRFGLAVDVTTPHDPATRAAIVRRRIAFDADPAAFASQWAEEERRLGGSIRAARERLSSVQLPDALLELIARICVAYEVDGLRADIVIYKAATALAALAGRERVTVADVRGAAELALPHRSRRRPFDDQGFDPQPLEQLTEEFLHPSEASSPGQGLSASEAPNPSDGPEGGRRPDEAGDPDGGGAPQEDAAAPDGPLPATGPVPASEPASGAPRQRFDPQPLGSLPIPDGRRPGAPPARATGAGRRGGQRGAAVAGRGHYVGSSTPRGRPRSVAFDATLRAAAPHQPSRSRPPAVRLRPEDLRERIYAGKRGRLLLFVVDASGSMAARRGMALAKGAVQAVLQDAYRRRDQVGLIEFQGRTARLALPPTNSVELAHRRLRDLGAGGQTPLAAALALADSTLERWRGAGGAVPTVILVTDGKANVGLSGLNGVSGRHGPGGVGGGDPWHDALQAAGRLRRRGVPALVVDTEAARFDLGLTGALAQALGATVLPLAAFGPFGR
ncbi:MAG TPA: VWA domain-containing protein [Chloroflexota bacterium]|nr:VWA domain-containing protein [Chloroflexota bacterium]